MGEEGEQVVVAWHLEYYGPRIPIPNGIAMDPYAKLVKGKPHPREARARIRLHREPTEQEKKAFDKLMHQNGWYRRRTYTQNNILGEEIDLREMAP